MTRTVLVSVLIGVIAIIAIVAAVHPEVSEIWIERLHIAGWTLGLADVLIIAIAFLTDK
jgi:putative ribosome biogenesis GTPase RsgA